MGTAALVAAGLAVLCALASIVSSVRARGFEDIGPPIIFAELAAACATIAAVLGLIAGLRDLVAGLI